MLGWEVRLASSRLFQWWHLLSDVQLHGKRRPEAKSQISAYFFRFKELPARAWLSTNSSGRGGRRETPFLFIDSHYFDAVLFRVSNSKAVIAVNECLEASGHQQIEFEKSRDFAIDSR
jgi:hypothetical protein